MTNNSNNNNDSEFSSPGQLLRAHREKLELSTHDIAKRIHLDVNVIEAIEKDNHDEMPSATYIRGYLRSYAKTVAADAEDVIALYNADSPPPLPQILPEVKPPTQASSSDKPVKAFTYLISLGLVLLLLIWYQSHYVVETVQDNEPETNNDNSTNINGVDVSYDVVVHPEEWQAPSDEIIETPEQAMEAMTQDEGESDLLTLQTDVGEETIGILPVENIDNEPEPVEFVDVDNEPEPIEAIDLDNEPEAIEVVSNTTADTILLTLTRDSWVEIVDADNKRLFHDLALADEQHLLSGTAPFKILLGFSSGVSIEFNGELFDHSSYANNGIARFSLPEE